MTLMIPPINSSTAELCPNYLPLHRIPANQLQREMEF
jgi:hypothetical protein